VPYYLKDGKPAQPGIAYAESDDGIVWRGGDLAVLRGRSVRLRFDLFKADLFALYF
jgi:hypothetical protein